MKPLGCIATLAALALVMPPTAGAEFLPGADLVSVSREQADASTLAVDISQDGRYVVFQTRARNLFPADFRDPPGEYRDGAIFRRELASGALELVALGDVRTIGSDALARRGAQSPSVDAKGRYVSFASADQLVPADTNTRIDVYVRDMDQALDSPSAFELVSARDGSDTPATYGGSLTAVTGADVTPEAALTADGRKVVFVTRAASDLPAAELPTTPAGQLFVRDLSARTTTLVTRTTVDGNPAGGASTSGAFAVISADGSTVAWEGQNAGLQTRLQPGEIADAVYYMWRRVADGPTAQTRRITGAADVDDPGCAETDQWINDENASGPCYGPLGNPEDSPPGALSGIVPSLSADGTKVAFLVNSPLRGTPLGNQLDVFVADMTPGRTRKSATIELTRESSLGVTGAIKPVVISADGSRIAFVSNRSDFGLPSVRLVTPPPATENAELYVIYLDRMEIERVTRARDGGEIDRDVGTSFGAIAMSGDGRSVAFTSFATNLFPGDSNEVADAFVTREAGSGGARSGPQEPPFEDFAPREDALQSAGASLPVSLRRGPGGSVRVIVKAPRAGSIAVTARARIRSGRRTPLRSVAKARKRFRAAGRVTLTLKPMLRYRGYVKRERRLRSRLEIRFSPTGGGRALIARRTASFTS